jgi:hypothetical protein
VFAGELPAWTVAARWVGAREGVGKVLEFRWAFGIEVDAEDVEAKRDATAIGLGELAEIGSGHSAEDATLGFVDLGFGGSEVAGSSGFDFEDDQRVAIPGYEVEVAREPLGAPAAGSDGVAEGSEVEEGCVFAAFSGEEVGWLLLLAEALCACG